MPRRLGRPRSAGQRQGGQGNARPVFVLNHHDHDRPRHQQGRVRTPAASGAATAKRHAVILCRRHHRAPTFSPVRGASHMRRSTTPLPGRSCLSSASRFWEHRQPTHTPTPSSPRHRMASHCKPCCPSRWRCRTNPCLTTTMPCDGRCRLPRVSGALWSQIDLLLEQHHYSTGTFTKTGGDSCTEPCTQAPFCLPVRHRSHAHLMTRPHRHGRTGHLGSAADRLPPAHAHRAADPRCSQVPGAAHGHGAPGGRVPQRLTCAGSAWCAHRATQAERQRCRHGVPGTRGVCARCRVCRSCRHLRAGVAHVRAAHARADVSSGAVSRSSAQHRRVYRPVHHSRCTV